MVSTNGTTLGEVVFSPAIQYILYTMTACVRRRRACISTKRPSTREVNSVEGWASRSLFPLEA